MLLEHVNLTVTDARRTADLLESLFDWRTRWEGESILGGYSIHVGTDAAYIALFSHNEVTDRFTHDYGHPGLNHIGVVVDDLDDVGRRVKEHGLETYNHSDYEPGRRFYFRDHDDLEIEVVSYARPTAREAA